MKRILLIPHVKIQNANALSSPYTIGFPAMTAWLGGVHALQRKLNQNGYEGLLFKSTAVVCHSMDLHTYKGQGDFVYSIVGTGNPLDKNGNRSPFIEEARCHLDISLVIECESEKLTPNDFDKFAHDVHEEIHSGWKLASGDILSTNPPASPTEKNTNPLKLLTFDDEDDTDLKALTRKLMPGFVIIERRNLMKEAMEKGVDAIDAMLDYLTIKHRSEQDESGKVSWTSERKKKGWIVPIATGFHGISELGKAQNQRDPETPHRFAESIVTLGEFIMPYRIKNLSDMLWHYHADLENDLYLCQQNSNSN